MKYPRIWIAAHGGEGRAAVNPKAPPIVLAILANSEDFAVRAAVAEHENTPPDVLLKLADDPYTAVRA